MIAAQLPIRLQLGITSNPPLPPLDLNTGILPQAWKNTDVAFELGIFAPDGTAVDLSNIDFLEVDIFPGPVNTQIPGSGWDYSQYSVSPYPTLPPAPLIFTTVPAADITDVISIEDWRAGLAQQVRAVFTANQMAQLELNGRDFVDFWLVVHGITTTGQKITYGGCLLRVFGSGQQGIYLPNNAAPILVPADTIFYIGPNQQVPYSTPIDIEGTIAIDNGSLIQV